MTRSADEQYLRILGPVLYGEVGDTIKIVFKNNASRPYNMHPHGVLYQKNSEGSGYNDGTSGDDKADDAVPAGATHIYITTFISGKFPIEPDQARRTAARSSGSIIPTWTKCAISLQACSAPSYFGALSSVQMG